MTTALDGKVCLVTGASRGIGAAIARRFSTMGGRVIVHYGQDRSAAEAVASSLDGDGHIVAGANLDSPNAAEELCGSVVEQTGGIDVLVNNAGIFTPHPPLQVDSNEWLNSWERILAVNLLSPAVLCHAAANVMKTKGGGRIVNIGSRGAFRGEPDCPAYGASKAALHSMSQSLAVSLAPAGILVFAVAPGFVATDMAQSLLDSEQGDAIRAQSPLNRVGEPEEVADIVAFLATSGAGYMTGSIIDVNGASYLRT